MEEPEGLSGGLLVLLWKRSSSEGQKLCPRGSGKVVTEWSRVRAKVFCYVTHWDSRVVKSRYRHHPGHLIHSGFLQQVSWAILWVGSLPHSHRRPWRHSPRDEIKAGQCTSGSGGRRAAFQSRHPPWLGSSEQTHHLNTYLFHLQSVHKPQLSRALGAALPLYIMSAFNRYASSAMSLLFSPIQRWRNWGTGKLGNWAKTAQFKPRQSGSRTHF